MPSVFVFTGASLSVQSVTPISATRVRLTFTQAPLRINPAGTNDALNSNNYIVSGPGAASISSIVAGPDTLSVDILFTLPLVFGVWTISVSNVQTSGGAGLVSPTSGQFTISQQQTSLTAGVEGETAYTVIRKHLNAALDGPNWQGLIHALASADDYVWDLARKAFDQLFLSTSSGKWLEKVAAGWGISKPSGVGFSDEQFRDFAIKLKTGRVTFQSIVEILESFYGTESIRAYVDSEDGPFALSDGQTLKIVLQGEEYIFEVNEDNFTSVGAATAQELAVALTLFFKDKQLDAVAVEKTNPQTGDSFVRIFSNSIGLASTIAISGGTAQRVLNFPTFRDIYTGTVTSGDGYNWVYALNSNGQTTLTLTTTGIPKLNIASLKIGDYVVIGPDTATQGSYSIANLSYTWSGASYVQVITLDENLNTTSTILQQSNSSYRFYSPTIHSIQNGERTVIVSQTRPNELDVVVPATADIDRTGFAGYLSGNETVQINSIERKNGLVTVTTNTPHGLTASRQVQIEGFVPAMGRPWVSAADGSYLGGSFVHALASTGNISGSASDIAAGSPGIEKRSDGIIVIGGWDDTGAAKATTIKVATTNNTVNDGSQANDSTKLGYTLSVLGAMATARWDFGHSMLTGPLADQIFITGGFNTTPTVLNTCEKLVGSSWTTMNPMSTARALHQQVTLDNGNVLVMGGVGSSTFSSLNSCELYQPLLNSWIPAASMNVPRSEFRAVKLSNGKVLAIGGFSTGQQTSSTSPNIIANWRFDSSTGTTTPDEGATYDLLTTAGVTTGKVGSSLNLPGGVTVNFPADALLQSVFDLSLTGAMSVEFWVKGFASASRALFFYENTSAVTSADNALLRIYSNVNNTLTLQYQTGTLTTKSVFTTNAGDTTSQNGWNHIAVTATKNAPNATYKVYINGVLGATLTNTAPSDGANSFLAVGYSPLGTASNWVGQFDEMFIWDKALSETEIQQHFLTGAGYSMGGTNRVVSTAVTTRRPLHSCELYDPNTNTWTLIDSMGSFRAAFGISTLDTGEIIVAGGYGHDNYENTITNAAVEWPNGRLATTEIFNPTTETWRRGPPLPYGRTELSLEKVGNRVYAVGDVGNGYGALFVNEIPWLDTGEMRWKKVPSVPRIRSWGFSDGSMVLMGGLASGSSHTRYFDAIIGNGTKGSSGGINGFHQVASAPTSTSLTFTTDTQTYTTHLGQNGTHEPSGSTFAFNTRTRSACSKTGGTTTVTVTVPVGTLAVYINSQDANFSSGLKILTNRTDTTIAYAEAGGPVSGNVYVSSPFVVPTTELVSANSENGIFILDRDSFVLRAGDSTLSANITKNGQYDILEVASTVDFSDNGGYVVVNFGKENQSKPLKYLEKISSTKLLMQSFTAEYSWSVGSTVSLVELDNLSTIQDGAWVTGSTSGLAAAKATVEESIANDIQLNWSVIYPGDRGLGGEDTDHSDDSTVWGSDDFEG